MGPAQSNVSNKVSDIEKIEINHPIFTAAEHVRVSEETNQIRAKIGLASKSQFEEWQKRVKTVPENDSLMLPIQQSYKSQGICSESVIAEITYPDYPYLLSDEIQNRKGTSGKFFEENELWYLVYTVLSSTYNYHAEERKTGDIRPDNIFINVDGHVKVASVDSWPGEQTNYEKSFFEKTITYLSPQEIKSLQFGQADPVCNKAVAQTFSVGLTVLDAATLSSSKDLYTKSLKFNYQKLDKKIEELRGIGYSEVLTLTIESMCEVDSEFRTTVRQVFDWLHPHEQAIANLEDFELDDCPEKMVKLMERNQRVENSNSQSQKVITSLTSQPTSSYTPAYVPTKIPTSFNDPSTIMGILPAPAISSYGTSKIDPLPSYNIPLSNYSLGYGLSSTAFGALPPLPSVSNYTPSGLKPLPSYNAPALNYSLGYEGSLSYSQPQSSYLSSGLYEQAKLPAFSGLNGTANTNLESHSIALSKIDQQLEMSKKMFPQ